jgi:Tol biopolymer transport system component
MKQITRRHGFSVSLAALLVALIPLSASGQEKKEEPKKEEQTQIPLSLLRMTQPGRVPDRAAIEVRHLIHENEKTFTNLERLTYEGDNGEAYFDPNARTVIYQSKMPGQEYDQIYVMYRDGADKRMVSTGKGRTTCAYFLKDGRGFLYASTHLREGPPPERPKTGGYEWEFDDAYDIFFADMEGKIFRQLTDTPGYDAEGTISPSGKLMLFTSERDGDLEVYCMRLGRGDVMRITNSPGYDGGAFFSPDESKIVYRGSRTEDYKDLQIFICDADGTNHRQLTHNNAVNFAPYFHPDGNRIIFSSNMDDPRNFELYMMKDDGSGVTRITYSVGFDGFPYFSDDGKSLLFCSNRADPSSRETHVFVAAFDPYWY